MSLFLVLALLIIFKATGIHALIPLFVQTGEDVLLNVSEADVPKDYHLILWKFTTDDVLASFLRSGESKVRGFYTGRVELSEKNYSIKLKNLQISDSGIYMATVTSTSEEILTQYKVTVQDPVGPVDLIIDSVSSASSSSCNLTVSCIAEDSNISSTFRCDNKTCHQLEGEGSKVTKSGASLHVFLSHSLIICNHSNQVSWSEKKAASDHLCLQNADAGRFSGVSICQVKIIVFPVSLIIMMVAVISVHLMEKFKKHT